MVLLVLFMFVLYLCIGGVVTYILCKLYSIHGYGRRSDLDESDAIVIGVFWVFTAPFAFAIYFAKYGFPKDTKRGEE
jgi:hypothetical protein